ncbi:unnamed protein product [Absidia cylindrospora]
MSKLKNVSESNGVLKLDELSDSDNAFELEDISSIRTIRGTKWYLVKWKGYDSDENSWQSEDTINAPTLMEKYWNGKRQRSLSSNARAERSSTVESSTSTIQTRSRSLRLEKLKRPSPKATATAATTSTIQTRSQSLRLEKLKRPSPKATATAATTVASSSLQYIPKYEDNPHQTASTVLNGRHLEQHHGIILGNDSPPRQRRTPPSHEQSTQDINPMKDDNTTVNIATLSSSANNSGGDDDNNDAFIPRKQEAIETTTPALSDTSTTTTTSEYDYRPKHVNFEGNDVKIYDDFRADWNWEAEVTRIEKAKVKAYDDMYLTSFYLVLRWNDGTLSAHDSKMVRSKCPLKVIDFYENQIASCIIYCTFPSLTPQTT